MGLTKVIIVGTGGHAKIIVDILERMKSFEIIGFTAKDNTIKNFYGYPVLGNDSVLSRFLERGIKHLALGVGGYSNNIWRTELYRKFKDQGFSFISAIDPSVVVSRTASIGEGNVIFPGVSLNSDVQTGNNVIIATNSSIDHESILKDHVLVSAGVTIGGNVKVENNVLIALGAKVISGVTIGENTIVAAGSTVVCDIKPNTIVFGTPAKERNSK